MAQPEEALQPRTGLLWALASGPDRDEDDDSTPQGDTDHDWWSPDGRPLRAEGASGLPQIQQVVDPNNVPDPDGDELPEGVAFPLGDNSPASPFSRQWSTGPGGPQPRTGMRLQARDLSSQQAGLLGHADAMDNHHPLHKEEWEGSRQNHRRYLEGWNETAGLIHGLVGRAPMNREEYASRTGREDLHSHYLAAYARGRALHGNSNSLYRADDGGQATASLRRQADTWTAPHATTDDYAAPFNSAQTSPDPWSQQQSGDFRAGVSAGQADRAAGERPLFADNSSTVSPYVKGYAQGYGDPGGPQGPRDVPLSMGGDSGQARNAGEAQRAFQVARASRRTASLRRVSASFAPEPLMRDPEFRKGYLFARRWKPGQRLAARGSARFEAGLYAGVTDTPGIQRAWLAEHGKRAARHPGLRRRIELHGSFTRKYARRARLKAQGVYVRQGGTSTDLITDGPGTSPDPMGSTPLNGPGTPPPMGGLSNPAAPGGAPPYQGTAPLPGGPVVPDDVMGRPQRQPQPDGPMVQTYSGMHPENVTLAPVAPNSADQSGYTNRDAYRGDPHGNDRLAAFRRKVQASVTDTGFIDKIGSMFTARRDPWQDLRDHMVEEHGTTDPYARQANPYELDERHRSIVPHPHGHSFHDPQSGSSYDMADDGFSYTAPSYVQPPRTGEELMGHLGEHHGVTFSGDKRPGDRFMVNLHDKMHYGEYADHPNVLARTTPHQHEGEEYGGF